MIVDLDAGTGELPEYDLCIVGSGPAGATVAQELVGSGLRICVLESGREKPTAHGDRLREVVSEGIHIKDWSRERVLGGASTSWAGLSSPLDRTDMGPRPWLDQPGWPIEREELLPYYEKAAAGYRFPPLAHFSAEGFGALRRKGDRQPAWSAVEEKVFLAADEPQDFSKECRATLEGEAVDCYLDATVVELRTKDGGPRVQTALLRTRGGRELELRARAFVIATGGLENARLLLASTDRHPVGLGNEHDQVGRYLMNHPKNYGGILTFAEPVEELPYYFGCLYQGFAGYAGFRLSEEELEQRGLLNAYVRLEPLFPWSDNPGIEALVALVKRSKFFFGRWKKRQRGKIVALRDYSETGDDSEVQNARKRFFDWLGLVGTILLHLPGVVQYAWFRTVAKQRPKIRRARLRNFMEMEPDPENRVLLAEERDPYGSPRALVRHRPSERDKRSLVELHAVLAEELSANGLGSLSSDLEDADPWPIDQDASHHMGTTRMGTDPVRSVVDPSGRLHGVENVYLAGASVFPTSGCANPTFTIVALSIRLAEHLRRTLSPSAAEALS